MRILRSDWQELRDAAWEWDLIGIGPPNEFMHDEYECVIEQVVPLLQRGATVPELVAHFDAFLPEHFGMSPQPERARTFAEKAIAWWARVHG